MTQIRRMTISSFFMTLLCLGLLAIGFAPALATTATADDGLGTVLDRDGDGRIGEATTIRQRARAYLERHSMGADLSSSDLLARTRWGYRAWLANDHQQQTKGIEGDGWVSLGPDNGAGRIVSIVPHPTNQGEILAGAAGGGLWRTVDEGITWTPLTDGLSDLSVGAAAYAPSNPSTIYLGTGEGGYAADFIPGIGLLRSDDGGQTWFLPLDDDDILASQFFDLEVVHPPGSNTGDPSTYTVLAATNRGLFRSTDGGESWTTSIAGAGLIGASEILRPDPAGQPDLFYAGLWCSGNCPTGLARVVASTDGGLSWLPRADGLPGTAPGNSSLNRTSLSSTSDGRTLYAGLNLPTGNTTRSAIYRSDDGGDSWVATASPGDYLGEQGWYDNTITVHPTDPNIAVAGGVWYVYTTNGGLSWSSPSGSVMPHVDAHDLEWQGDRLWVGCDGGVWLSDNNGRNWSGRNNTLVTRQFYGMALDPIHRERVIGGTQDNSTNIRRGDDNAFDVVIGGDGFECAINPYIPDIMYGTVQFGLVFRNTSGGFGQWQDVTPDYGNESTPFITLITMRPEAPWVLYTGGESVFRSTDAGDSWQPLPTEVELGAWSSGLVRAIAVTPADDQMLVVSKGSVVYTSDDAGTTWHMAVVGPSVINLDISPFDSNLVLAATANNTSGTSGIMRSTDGGNAWSASSTGLPPFTVQVARWDPTDPMVAYAGTDVGLYRSTDGGLTWSVLGNGLPAASIHDLRILPDGSMLRVATHGRGIWELAIEQTDNQAPTVAITSPSADIEAAAGTTVDVAATASDADGDPLELTWVVGGAWQLVDGGSGIGSVDSSTTLTLDGAGRYQIAAYVADDKGGAAFDAISAVVTEAADDCSTPRVIPSAGPFPITVVTSNDTATMSTSDPLPSCPFPLGTGRSGSIWFEFTPAESNSYVLSTCGSAADTVLTVFTGDACGPLTEVEGGCSHDDDQQRCGGSDDSYLELELDAGTTYRIMVGSYIPDGTGGFLFNLECDTCTGVIPGRQYIVPAAAHADGDNNTTWVTDLNLFNPSTAEVAADLAFLPADADNSLVDEVAVTIAAGGAREDHDVVSDLFSSSGPGAIRIIASDDLLIASRTYNTTASGTFGQFIPGVDDPLAAGESLRLIGLAGSPAFRTNVGLANASDTEAGAIVELYDSSGELLVSRSETVPPFGWLQINRIFGREGLVVESASAVVENASSDASVVVYASVVDELTGDPTYVGRADSATPGAPLWIAAAAHVDGVGDSVWRTDVELANVSQTDATVTVELFLHGQGNPSPALITASVAAGRSVGIADILGERFAVSTSGALRVSVDAGEVMVTSRTYNLTDSGTYGQFIPGAPESAATGNGQRAILTQLRHDAEGFRTNLGLVNITAQTIVVDAVYSDVDSGVLGSSSTTLAPFEYRQINGAVPGNAGTAGGFAVLESATAGARFLAYASVIDRGSDDPVFIPAEVLNQ